jgi:succinate-semialdehyde dehydrogenase / glutarate-semialdehyde dehydrogenase
MYEPLALLIDGRFIEAKSRDGASVLNPATGEPLATLPHATTADLDDALRAAARAFPLWRAVPAVERGRILRRAADLMRERAEAGAAILTMEQGKPLAEARLEVLFAADVIEWFAEEGRRAYGRIVPGRNPRLRQHVAREPVGPVAAFTPWNFPATTPARKLGGALAAGCSVIIKPSEETPGSAIFIARALQDAGLPAGVLNMVFGLPATISAYLVASPVIRKVTLTGSVPVGRHVAKLAAEHLKVVTLELGGHAPAIICDDVDIESAADAAVAAKFRNAGQICIAPTRFFVQERVHDRFLAAVERKVAAIRVGNGMEPGVTMGPLANARRVEAVDLMIQEAVADGARIVAGGHRIGNIGHFYAPTVLADTPAHSRIMREEPFGPVAPVSRFDHLEQAIGRANELAYGLAAYAFTKSADHAVQLAESLEAGMVGLNSYIVAQPELPFTGIKDSGYGSESGQEGLEAFMVPKTVTQMV